VTKKSQIRQGKQGGKKPGGGEICTPMSPGRMEVKLVVTLLLQKTPVSRVEGGRCETTGGEDIMGIARYSRNESGGRNRVEKTKTVRGLSHICGEPE